MNFHRIEATFKKVVSTYIAASIIFFPLFSAKIVSAQEAPENTFETAVLEAPAEFTTQAAPAVNILNLSSGDSFDGKLLLEYEIIGGAASGSIYMGFDIPSAYGWYTASGSSVNDYCTKTSARADGVYKCLFPTSYTAGLPDGNVRLTIYAATSPFTSWAVDNVNLVKDSTPGTATVVSPSSGYVTGTVDLSANINVNVDNWSGVYIGLRNDANAVVKENGASGWCYQQALGYGLPNGTYSCSNFDTTTLPDGDYQVEVWARSTVDTWITDVISITIDNTAPATPSFDKVVKTSNNSLVMTCQNENSASFSTVGYTNEPGVTFSWNLNSETDIAGYWFGTKTNPHHQFFAHPLNTKTANMTPGNNPYYYSLSAVDNAGNESARVYCGQVILDQDAPVIKSVEMIVNGVSQDYVTAGDEVKIVVTVEDAYPMSSTLDNRFWMSNFTENWATGTKNIKSAKLVCTDMLDGTHECTYTFSMPDSYMNSDGPITQIYQDQYFNGRVFDSSTNSKWFSAFRFTYYELTKPDLGFYIVKDSAITPLTCNEYFYAPDSGNVNNSPHEVYGGDSGEYISLYADWTDTALDYMVEFLRADGTTETQYYTSSNRSYAFDHGYGVESYKVTAFFDANQNDMLDSGEPTVVSDICNVNFIEPLSVEIQPDSINMMEGDSIDFSAIVTGGVSDFTYEWSGVCSSFVGANGSKMIPLAGDYECTVKVTDTNGVTAEDTVLFTVKNYTPSVSIVASPSNSVTSPNSIQLNVNVMGGNMPYMSTAWSGDCYGTATIFTLSTVGTFTCTYKVIDADGDIVSDTITVTILPQSIQQESTTNTNTNTRTNTYTAYGNLYSDPTDTDQTDSTQEEQEETGDILGAQDCTNPSKVYGFIYFDLNANGEKDEDEDIITNLELEINTSSTDEIITARTDSDGRWESSLCAGSYTVAVASIDDLPDSVDSEGSVLSQTFTVNDGDEEVEVSFALSQNTQDTSDESQPFNWTMVLLIVLAAFIIGMLLLRSRGEDKYKI